MVEKNTALKGKQNKESRTKKVGLALGSGSARGLAHIGVLKVLDREGIPIDFIAGTSAGALIGAIYAAGISPFEIEEITLNIDRKKTISLFTPTISNSGLLDGSRIEKFIESILGRQNIGSLKIPFAAVATDLQSGEEIIITEGSLITAIRASMSIPGIFTPVEHNGRLLVDGGLVNPVPVSTTIGMGADIVIAVNVLPPPQKHIQNLRIKKESRTTKIGKINSKIVNTRLGKCLASLRPIVFAREFVRKKTSGPNIFSMILQSITITNYQISALQLTRYKPDFLISPETGFIRPHEFFRAKEAILAGEKAALAVLPEIKDRLENPVKSYRR